MSKQLQQAAIEIDDEVPLVDITYLVEQCAVTSLNHSNPLLCNEASFSLHDSMAALELMDRKMDCCELPVSLVNPLKYNNKKKNNNNNNNKNDDDDVDVYDDELIVPPRQIPTGLNTTADTGLPPLPWTELTVQDAADIGIEILTRLESLLSGASVAESTYTCLYAHNAVLKDMKECVSLKTKLDENSSNVTERLGGIDLAASRNSNDKNRINTELAQFLVYAQTLALVEISDVVRSIILHADIYEEEDFSVNTFGLQFFPDADGPETMKTLEQALDRLEQYDDFAEADDTVSILTLIITFQLKLLQTCTSLAKLSAAPARQVTTAAQAIVRSGVADLERLQVLLLKIQASSSSSTSINDNEKNPLLTKCFDPYIYRPLVGSSPVRKVAFHASHESVPILIQIFSEIDWAVCDLLLFGSTMMNIRRLLNRVSVSSVNVLSRSLIVLNLYFDDKLLGQHALGYLIGNEMMRMMSLPQVLLESKYGKAFLNRLAKPMYDTLKLMVLNRNRQRIYMEAIMFHDWSALQQEAHVVDMNHRQELGDGVPPYFTQYALYTMVWLMDHHVALGIELRLYCGQHDLAVAYWYRDFLLSSLLSTLSSIRGPKKLSQQLDQRKQQQQQQNGRNASIDEDLQYDMDVMIIGFKRSLCRGIVRFIATLNQAKMVQPEVFEFTSHEKRFQKQFESFGAIVQPPPLTYNDFQSGSDFNSVSQTNLLSSTSDCFKKCKTMLDKISNHAGVMNSKFSPLRDDCIRGLTKVCVGNSVFLMKLTQQVRGAGTAKGKVTFDFDANTQFCTIKIDN